MGQINGQYVEDDPGIGFDWSGLINQGFDFGKNFINQKYAKDTAKAQAQAQALLAYQPAVGSTLAATTSGIGIGVDGEGVRLSDGSHIGWIWIIGGIGVVALLQSRGFQRRSR